MFNPADDIDAIQASLLRTLASAHRLRIIHRLGIGPCEVNEISRDLGLGQAATSQHLAAMRAVGLVDAVRDGRTMRYELCDPEILVACSLMRGALVRRLSRLGDLAAAAGQASIVSSQASSAAGQPSIASSQPPMALGRPSAAIGRSSTETPSSKVTLP